MSYCLFQLDRFRNYIYSSIVLPVSTISNYEVWLMICMMTDIYIIFFLLNTILGICTSLGYPKFSYIIYIHSVFVYFLKILYVKHIIKVFIILSIFWKCFNTFTVLTFRFLQEFCLEWCLASVSCSYFYWSNMHFWTLLPPQ